MVVAAAILAFALRSDLSGDYTTALYELSALKEVSFDGWATFISDRYRVDEASNDKFALSVVHMAGLSIQGHPTLGQPIYGDSPPFMGAPLHSFDSFISDSRKIGVIVLGADKGYVADQLKHAVAARNPHPVVTGMWLDGFGGGLTPLVNGLRMLDWRNPSASQTATLNFNINDQPQTVPNAPVFVIVPYTIRSESGHLAEEWLKTDAFGQKLIDPNTGIALPNLKKFWDKVNGFSVDQATIFFQEQLESSKRGTLSFFGIPVERSLAISAGPVICFSILLFLCLHVRHFRSVAPEANEARDYPWVPLFKGVWGWFVTFVTILILPVLANAVLLTRFGHWQEQSTKMGTVSAILTLGVGVWTLIEINKLRREILR